MFRINFLNAIMLTAISLSLVLSYKLEHKHKDKKSEIYSKSALSIINNNVNSECDADTKLALFILEDPVRHDRPAADSVTKVDHASPPSRELMSDVCVTTKQVGQDQTLIPCDALYFWNDFSSARSLSTVDQGVNAVKSLMKKRQIRMAN